MPVRFPKQGNDWWPLPADYPELGEDGKRLARINACSLQNTPDDFVTAWSFFRSYYLATTPEGFFYKRLKPSPPFHYEIVRFLAMHDRNAIAAPRASAKSTVIGAEVPLLLTLTRPYFKTALILAVDFMVERRFSQLMRQLTDNERIIEDFGTQKPSAQQGKQWNLHSLETRSGGALMGYSIEGRMRGERPDLIILDDPEFDERHSTDTRGRKEDLANVIFRTILGMLEEGSVMYWIGTMISRQSFLYYACTSDDPRFAVWNRHIFGAEWTDDATGERKYLWEGKWNNDSLARKKVELGAAAYAAEMLNQPISDEARILTIDPIKNTYVLDPPLLMSEEPLNSAATLMWHSKPKQHLRGAYQKYSAVFSEKLAGMFRFATLDFAPTTNRLSDFSCVMVMGLDKDDLLWLLDIWLGKVRDYKLIKILWDLAIKWRCKVLGVEAVAAQEQLYDRVRADLGEMSRDVGWHPSIIPIRYGAVSKANRISGMSWRFEMGRIKYPEHLKTSPMWRDLVYQTENFTMDLRSLDHDDAIDSVAMHQWLIKRRGVRIPIKERATESIRDHLTKGVTEFQGLDLPPVLGINAADIPASVLAGYRPTGIMDDEDDGYEDQLIL